MFDKSIATAGLLACDVYRETETMNMFEKYSISEFDQNKELALN
jgi:hypothetical protein